jgi:acyl-CoA synthetase (AMP-forming)/AMP-acid ligase II
MLSHENLVANSRMIQDMFGHGAEVRGVGWLPLFHDMGLIGHVLQPVFNGGLSVLMSPLTFLQSPLTWLNAFADWNATASGGPTYGFELCANRVTDQDAAGLDLSAWRVAYCGSEPIRAEAMERFAAKFAASGFSRGAIYACYGLAEATVMVTGSQPGTGLKTAQHVADTTSKDSAYAVRPELAACGRACPGEMIVIVDPDVGTPVDDGVVGEIWVSGPNVGRGYWRRPLESADVFGARLDGIDGDFLRTGDLGFLRDGDFVVGRMKDMIIVRGTNHAPQDIEATVASCYGPLARAAQTAFGIDVAGREEVVVVQEVRAELSDDETAAAAFEQVAQHHGLRLYDLVLVPAGTLPRTSSGKVRRSQCRELYAAGLLDRQNDPGELPFLGLNVEARAALTNV